MVDVNWFLLWLTVIFHYQIVLGGFANFILLNLPYNHFVEKPIWIFFFLFMVFWWMVAKNLFNGEIDDMQLFSGNYWVL